LLLLKDIYILCWLFFTLNLFSEPVRKQGILDKILLKHMEAVFAYYLKHKDEIICLSKTFKNQDSHSNPSAAHKLILEFKAMELRETGNEEFQKGSYRSALGCYTEWLAKNITEPHAAVANIYANR